MPNPEYPIAAEPELITEQTALPMQQSASTGVSSSFNRGPYILVRVLWFCFLGSWLGGYIIVIGYLLCVCIVTMPLGLKFLNRLPQTMTLSMIRLPSQTLPLAAGSGNAGGEGTQRPFPQRVIYFLLIGWWLGAAWMCLAWAVAILWILTLGWSMDVTFRMFDRIPTIMTLHRTLDDSTPVPMAVH